MSLAERETETMTREIRAAGSLWRFTAPGAVQPAGRGFRRAESEPILAWAYLSSDVDRFGGKGVTGERVLVIERGPFDGELVRGPWTVDDPQSTEPAIQLSELRREPSHLVGVLKTGGATP